MYVKIPELNITPNQRQELIQCFYDNHKYASTYISEKGTDTTLTILTDIPDSPDVINKLIEKIAPEYYFTYVFLGNNGCISPHVDDTRQAVITFPLIVDDTPTTFIDENEYDKIDDALYYDDYQTVIWNTKHWHKVLPSEKFRLFFQIELKQDSPYDFYIRQLKAGNLLR